MSEIKSCLKEIVSGLAHLTFVRMILLLRTLAEQFHVVHEPLNTLVIDLKSTIMQLRRNSADTISLPVLIVNSADLCGKTCIPESNCVSPAKFIVVGGPGHSHCCQQVLQFVSSVAEFFDDCCFLALSRAASFSSLKAISFL